LDCGEKGLLAASARRKKSCKQAIACADRAATICHGTRRGADVAVGEKRAVGSKTYQHGAGSPGPQNFGGGRGICE
jgi:hypothetical protein